MSNRSGFPFFLVAVYLAILSLTSCGSGRRAAMLALLDEADSLNRNYIPLTNDSALLDAVSYFDSHGTANERMRARYLLGCTYRDLNEELKALDAFHNAASAADTTVSDCDYHTLSRVHAQMAGLFYDQLLPYEMLEELEHYRHYALLDGDTLLSIDAYARRADAYDILADDDSIISIRQNAYDMFLAEGDTTSAVMNACTIVVPLIEKGDVHAAASILSSYESLPDMFDVDGTIDSYHNIYYYIKGRYLLAVSKLDSAEYMFRKMLEVAETTNEFESAYAGLSILYKQRNNSDSVAKYAMTAYHLCDSLYQDDAKEQLQKMHSLYNYESEKLSAIFYASEARKAKYHFYIISLVLILIISLSCYIITVQRRKRRIEIERLNLEYQKDLDKMRTLQHDLLALQEQQYSEVAKAKDSEIRSLRIRLNRYLDSKIHDNAKTVDEKIQASDAVMLLKEKLSKPNDNPVTNEEWEKVFDTINRLLPRFFEVVNERKSLSYIEYNICVLIRLGFQPKEVVVLLGLPLTYNITMMRKRLLSKVFDMTGSAKDLDRYIREIS